jgi:hypothetical protein
MRYSELLNEARPWKKYQNRIRPVLIASPADVGDANAIVMEAMCHYGDVCTGRSEVFWGFAARVVSPLGEEWLGEDRHSLRSAFQQAGDAAQHDGWSLIALGCTPEFRESGLSANSGYGYHPAYPDRAVHMLEPIPRQRNLTS